MRAPLPTLTARYRERLAAAARFAAADLSSAVVAGTPVDTGRARKSFTPSIGRPDESNKGGNIATVANRLEPGATFYLVSSLPYIRPLEYGWSDQAPSGMVRVNVARWDAVVDDAVRRAAGIG